MESTARHIRIFAVAAIIGVAALLCLASCSRSKTAAELERISLLTEEYPDSALQLLLATDTAAFADRADRARFAVALTNARYLAYDPDCNDSLLSLQADYFADAPADRFKMLYLYLSATFKIERKLFTEAITQLFDAAQIAEASADHLYAGRIYRAITDIYAQNFDAKQSIKYAFLSLLKFKECNKTALANWQIIRIAESYYNIKEYNKSLILAKISYNKAINEQDKELELISRRIAARDYMSIKQFTDAIAELQNLDYYEPVDYFTLSYSYLNLNEIDSAIFYNNKLLEVQPYNKEMSFRIAKKTGDIKTMAKELDSEFNRKSDFVSSVINSNLIGVESEYFKINSIKKEFEIKNQFTIFVSIASILILLTIAIIIHHRRTLKFKESEIEKYAMIARNLQTKFDKLSSETNSSIKSDFSLISELSQEFIINDKSNTNKIYSKVQKIIEDYRTSDITLERLEHDVDLAFNGLASRFKNEMPEIYPIYNRLFLLIALGFDSQSIPAILGVTQRAYYNKKNRLVTLLRDNPSILADQLLSALKSTREKKHNHTAKP